MPNEHNSESKPYDKIFKENLGDFFVQQSKTLFGSQFAKVEVIRDKLQTTLEREADFLCIVENEQHEQFILHLEFQTMNETEMLYRMQEYHAILQKKYKLPIRQWVIYFGEERMTMRTRLAESEIFYGFEVLNFAQQPVERYLAAALPEEIILAILCYFPKEKAEEIVQRLLQNLRRASREPIIFEKYVRQLLVLSRLRGLQSNIHQQLKAMSFVFDIEKDALYQEGFEKGIEKGIEKGFEKGVQQKTIQGIQKALQQGKLSLEDIAEVFEVSLEVVLKIQKREVS